MERCAFDVGGDGCTALTKKNCSQCRFYKTASQVAESQKATEMRLDLIPGGLFLYKKYYCCGEQGGKKRP